jgi:hypothetical protein
MFIDAIKSPRCPKCGAMMSLRIIEPERPGFDSRTFECPKSTASISPVAPREPLVKTPILRRCTAIDWAHPSQ